MDRNDPQPTSPVSEPAAQPKVEAELTDAAKTRLAGESGSATARLSPLGGPVLGGQQAREAAKVTNTVPGLVRPEVAGLKQTPGRDQLTGRSDTPLQQATDAARASLGRGGFDAGYRHSDTEHFPDQPSNTAKGPPQVVGPPSSDPRDWASGSAAGGPDVSGVAHKRYDAETGRTIYHLQDGNTVTIQGNSRTDWIYGADGGLTLIHYRRDEQTAQWQETTREYMLPEDAEDLARNPDPNAPTGGGAGEHFYHGQYAPPPEVTKVNPGPEGAAPQPEAPRLRPPALATDPWKQRDPGTRADAERLSERMPRVIGPGGHPGAPGNPK